ncbi:MoxR-like ATPase [Persephonella hydrogeniphila]|uniref:MoxR-like ATPase n=1 Tax=Persephonella hydrogeniphila TaxID=198703 RepID=A0A285N0J1_9AQUI|nr:MoxR family ATPase [Persephonella hydrogeniphila]SNZ02975.1 MoxR-like ATPase [Persephonella hydrogeniphila]
MEVIKKIKNELKKAIIGQEKMVDALLIGLITEGHILIEGVPGVAKTTAVKTLGKVLNLDFKRIQFTPDLIPSDILGGEIYIIEKDEFRVKKGPIFTNLLLADEINRAPAKVQSALLEAMQERQVTIGEDTFPLDEPFLVMATLNPIEEEGVYNLPEAQLDRFLMKVVIDYPDEKEEYDILKLVVSKEGISNDRQEPPPEPQQVATKEEIINLKSALKEVHVDKEVEEYMVNLTMATRTPEKYGIPKEYIRLGLSPRATINLYKVSKAVALINGKDYVSPSDIISYIKDVFRHRFLVSFHAEAEGITTDNIIDMIVEKVPMP